jgi:amino acid transporter
MHYPGISNKWYFTNGLFTSISVAFLLYWPEMEANSTGYFFLKEAVIALFVVCVVALPVLVYRDRHTGNFKRNARAYLQGYLPLVFLLLLFVIIMAVGVGGCLLTHSCVSDIW